MGNNRIIYIRTDGNSNIATGHLVRCISIAEACLNLGMKICFFVSDEESERLLHTFLLNSSSPLLKHYALLPSGSDSSVVSASEHLLPVIILKTAVYNDLEMEFCEINSFFYDNPQWMETAFLLDSYYASERYVRAVRLFCKIAYLNDFLMFQYPVDLMINYDVIPDDALPDYENAYQKAIHTMLGAAYAPLRSQFQNRKISLRESASEVLVTTGGSDPYHFCLRFLEAMQETAFNLHIVIGSLNTDKDELYALAKNLPNIRLHENVTDMAALMDGCDLAVSAAGTTLYELCALGIPTISFTMANNQISAAKAFSDAGAIPCAGDIRTSCEFVLTAIRHFLTRMSENMAERAAAQESMHKLVDGNGAIRIAEAIKNL